MKFQQSIKINSFYCLWFSIAIFSTVPYNNNNTYTVWNNQARIQCNLMAAGL